MTATVIVGGGGHARVVAAVAARTGRFELVGYTARPGGAGLGHLNLLGDDDVLPDLARAGTVRCAIPAVGIIDTGPTARVLHERLAATGLELPPLVSSTATVHDDVMLGPGTVVLDGAIVNPGARIGAGCIVNTHATVEHDCRIGDYCHIAPGAVLCGTVTLGDQVLVGAGACVVPGIRIPDRTLVAAGATVIRSPDTAGIYAGVPAHRIRSR